MQILMVKEKPPLASALPEALHRQLSDPEGITSGAGYEVDPP